MEITQLVWRNEIQVEIFIHISFLMMNKDHPKGNRSVLGGSEAISP